MAPPKPEGPVPQGSMHCHWNVPALPVRMVKVVFDLGALGTLMPSLAMVKVCDTPLCGSIEVTAVAGASALGSVGSSAWTWSGPVTPVAVANCSDPAGSAVASSKLTIVMLTVVLAGRVRVEGT